MPKFTDEPSSAELVGEVQPLAALDLGSNNFHVIVAIEQPNRWRVIDRHKELTRLAAGLNQTQIISRHSINVAYRALERIGQRIRNIPKHNVRVVATHALRVAKNSAEFIEGAEQLIEHPIEVISGSEEARLIYLGASQSLDHQIEDRLVVDIGGGSTELIQGRRFLAKVMQSLQLGCVSLSERFFVDGKMTTKRFKRAIDYTLDALLGIERFFPTNSWRLALGTSGTIQAIQFAITGLSGQEVLTPTGLAQLKDRLVEIGQVKRIDSTICNRDRAVVLPGGLAVLIAVFDALNIDAMQKADGALREGVLYDLSGRIHNQDVREITILDLMNRFHIDASQAERVRDTAKTLFGAVRERWRLNDDEHESLLRWAALLHEIGMDISHSKYHRHGEYLVQNLDMPGFSHREQSQLAILIFAHRRRFPSAEVLASGSPLTKLAILLRLAVVLHRNRSTSPLPQFSLNIDAVGLSLHLPTEWLHEHRLTLMDIEREMSYLRVAPYQLTLND